MLTFPTLPGLKYPIKRTPQWSTAKLTALSGRESRIARWSYPVYKYSLEFEFLRSGSYAEYELLLSFYNAVGGSANPWLFVDPNDYSVTNQRFGVGDGVTTQFQLVRAFGGYTEPVLAQTNLSIYSNGVAVSGVGQGANGVLTFPSAPAAGAVLTWTGTFAWVCRFDDDDLDFSQVWSGMWEAKSVNFTTIKP